MGAACSSAQLRNITLCSQLHEVHRSLLGLLPRLPPSAAVTLRRAYTAHTWFARLCPAITHALESEL